MSLVGCPADAADRPGELALAVASGPSLGRAGTRAVDRDDRRRIRNDKVNDLLARHMALERPAPAIIDDRGVEALPLSAHINADPSSHESKHAPPPRSALWTRTRRIWQFRDCHRHATAPWPSAAKARHGSARSDSVLAGQSQACISAAMCAAPDWKEGRLRSVSRGAEFLARYSVSLSASLSRRAEAVRARLGAVLSGWPR
jgi:hypothetical protein